MKLSRLFASPSKLRPVRQKPAVANGIDERSNPARSSSHARNGERLLSPEKSASVAAGPFPCLYLSPNSSQSLLEQPYDDDLDENVFYATLRRDYPKVFHRVSVLCVPYSKSIIGLKINRAFVESHSLMPSPYFQGQYESVNGKVVSIEDNTVKALSGFKEERVVRILGEQLVYDESYKSVQVLILERPLEGVGKPFQDVAPSVPVERCHEKDLQWLQGFPENQESLHKMAHMVAEFNETYIYVRGYAGSTVERITQIFSKSVQSIFKTNATLRSICRNQHDHDLFHELVENVVMSEIHYKIFIQSLYPIFTSHDSYLESIMHAYARARITLKDYGVSERLQELPEEMLNSACEILGSIDEDDGRENLQFGLGITDEPRTRVMPATTPLEKLFCVKRAIQEIANVSDTYLNTLAARSFLDDDSQRSSITTDDFIPLLAYVIVQSRIKHLGSILFYMQTFRLSKIERSELSFALTTLRASTEFLKSDPLLIHDAVSSSSISSIASSHSSYKLSFSLSPGRIRSRSTSLSTPSTPVSTPASTPSTTFSSHAPHTRSSSGSGVQQPRDRSPARSVKSVSSLPTATCMQSSSVPAMGQSYQRSHADDLSKNDFGPLSSSFGGCPDDQNHTPARRMRRSSVTPVIIKPQIIVVPSRTQRRSSLDSDCASLSDSLIDENLPSKPLASTVPLPTIGQRSDGDESTASVDRVQPLPQIRSPNARSNSHGRRTWRHSIHAPEIVAVIPPRRSSMQSIYGDIASDTTGRSTRR